MSTRGCIGIRSGDVTHLVFSTRDSYPAGLGHSLVTQISEANLELWRQLASKISVTEAWFGPDFRLTDGEITRIKRWLSERVEIETWISTHPTPPGRICAPPSRSEWGPIWAGGELATIVEPTLAHDPSTFYTVLGCKIYPLLDLGLLPRLSPAFLMSPFCEWVYVIDLVDDVFVVGTHGNYDEADVGPSTNPWEPSEGEFACLARFPMTDIPQDWEEQVKTQAGAEG